MRFWEDGAEMGFYFIWTCMPVFAKIIGCNSQKTEIPRANSLNANSLNGNLLNANYSNVNIDSRIFFGIQ